MSDSYCRRCCRQFGSEMSLWQHENNSRFHRSLVFICHICGEGFQEEDELDEHKESDHPHACGDCDRNFDTPNSLREHSKVHLPRNIECTHCNLCFSLLGGLFNHLEAGACSSGFNRQQLNSVAQRMDRKGLFTLDTSDDSSDSSEDYYQNYSGDWVCEKCDGCFNKESDVIKHLRSAVHSENLFVCNGCDAEFIRLSGLAQHLESRTCGWSKGLRILKSLVYGLRTGRRFTLDH